MAQRPRRTEHRSKVYAELKAWLDASPKEDERSTAIVGAAMLDGALTHALRATLVPGKAVKRLLDDGPGGLSFAAKIDVAFAAGVIAKGAWEDLHTIRRVRNNFAHNLQVRSFRERSVANLCTRLASARDTASHSLKPEPPRVAFANTCLRLGFTLLKPLKPVRAATNIYDNDVIRRERRAAREAKRPKLL